MALQKTNTESKLIETSEIEKVAQEPGQIIFTDDGRLFYDNTQMGRLKLTRSALEPQSVVPNSLILPGEIIEKDASRGYGYTVELETNEEACRWINSGSYRIVTHEFPPHHGSETVLEISLDTLDSYSKQFFELLMNSDTDTSCIRSDTFEDATPGFFVSVVLDTGETKDLIFYKDPRNLSYIYMSTEQGTDPFEASRAEATRMRVSVRLKPLYCDLIWDGLTLSARVGTPQSDGVAFGAQNIYRQNPITGDKSKLIAESDWKNYSSYTFIDPGTDVSKLTQRGGPTAMVFTEDRDQGDNPFPNITAPFRSEWLSSDRITCFLPVNSRNVYHCVYFDDSTISYGRIVEQVTDCGDGCVVQLESSLPASFTPTEIALDVDPNVTAGDVIGYHNNIFGVGVYENLSKPIESILDEVDPYSASLVKSSGIAAYVDQRVSGAFRFRGSCNPHMLDLIAENGASAGDIYSMTSALDSYSQSIAVADQPTVSDLTATEMTIPRYALSNLQSTYGLVPGDMLELAAPNSSTYNVRVVSIGVIDPWVRIETIGEFPFEGSDITSRILSIIKADMTLSEGDMLVFTGVYWDRLSPFVDLSEYAKKSDISTVFRYCGNIGSADVANVTWKTVPKVGDVYNLWNATTVLTLDVSSKSLVATLNGSSIAFNKAFYDYFTDVDAVSYNDYTNTRVKLLDTNTGSYGVYTFLSLSDLKVGGNVYSGEVLGDGTYQVVEWIIYFYNKQPGSNACWNGMTFDVLGGGTDVSKFITSEDAAATYQPKLTIDKSVSSTSTNPVENKAVHEAIQKAVSGVYKPVGSYTVEALNLNSGAYGFNIGDVVNVVDSGTITLLRVSKKEAYVTEHSLSEPFTLTLTNPYAGESADTVEGVVVSNDAGISVSLSKSEVSIHYDTDRGSIIDITLTEEQFTAFGFSTSSSGSDPEFLTVELVRSPLEVLAGDNLVLTDAGWDRLSGTIDLSGYQQKLDFAESFTAEGASGKVATVGVAKDYIDQQIALNTQGTGAIVNLVGSGQATLLSSYVTSSTTTLTTGEYLWSSTLSSPAYKIILPAVDFPGSYQCTFLSDDNLPSISMPLSSSEMVVLEIIKGGTNGIVISNRVANGAMTATHMYTGVNLSAFNSFYITATSAATIPANTSIEVYGWPCVQDSDTATSIMDMLKEIYDTQEDFKSRTDILDTTGLTRTYANYSDLPITADVGSLATVSADSDAGKRGLYMFMSGIWNKLSFSSETVNSGDTVLATLE